MKFWSLWWWWLPLRVLDLTCPLSPPCFLPGECDAGACYCVDVHPPLHGVLGMSAGKELSCSRLAWKLSLLSPDNALLIFPHL